MKRLSSDSDVSDNDVLFAGPASSPSRTSSQTPNPVRMLRSAGGHLYSDGVDEVEEICAFLDPERLTKVLAGLDLLRSEEENKIEFHVSCPKSSFVFELLTHLPGPRALAGFGLRLGDDNNGRFGNRC